MIPKALLARSGESLRVASKSEVFGIRDKRKFTIDTATAFEYTF